MDIRHPPSRYHNIIDIGMTQTGGAEQLRRPLSLSLFNSNVGRGQVLHAHAAHHRYPVWWTGDGVALQTSVETMVQAGIYDLAPYVHSECVQRRRPESLLEVLTASLFVLQGAVCQCR